MCMNAIEKMPAGNADDSYPDAILNLNADYAVADADFYIRGKSLCCMLPVLKVK